MSLVPSGSCPISSAPPFTRPWRRATPPRLRRRLLAWCGEILPGGSVGLTEWAGADPRHPLHAVVLSFPEGSRPQVVLYRKAEDIDRPCLAEALAAG